MTLYCPVHGEIPEDEQLNSAGGKFCPALLEDESNCMQPLEKQQDADTSQ